MQAEHPAPALFERYLHLLGVSARPPGLEALRELTAAHVVRVPFENLSKLYHRRDESMRLPPLDRFLDGVERHRLGGTCYSNNYHLSLLLEHLGYDVRLCGADMMQPDVHVVNVVTVKGRELVVDVGYGAPFTDPLPLDLSDDVVVGVGADRYVLKPRSTGGRSRMEMHRDGELRHGYWINPSPRQITEFSGVIADSFSRHATFMNALLIVRFHRAGSVSLHNLQLRESNGPVTRTHAIPGPDALPAVIEQCFGIDSQLARRALAGIGLSRNVFA